MTDTDFVRQIANEVWKEAGKLKVPVCVAWTAAGKLWIEHASYKLNTIEQRNLQVLSGSIVKAALSRLRPDGYSGPSIDIEIVEEI